MAESQTKVCQNCKQRFVIEPDDFAFYEKMQVPPVSVCPTCRFQRRMVWRNERTLYRRTCDLCKRSIITMYHPRAPHPVYCNDCWVSDTWDPRTYARRYDFSRPFFDQLAELLRAVPQSATYSSVAVGPNINSEYTNFAGGNKDGYLVFNSGPGNENVAYSRGLMNCRDVFDSYFATDLERAYGCINVNKSAGVAWAQNATDCLDSWLLKDCAACTNCFGCVNLRHKSYHFYNEPLGKEEYQRRVGAILGSYARVEEAWKRFGEHVLAFPHREHQSIKAVHSTGNYLFEVKNCYECFEVAETEDARYCFAIKVAKDCMDMLGHCRRSELLLDGVGVGVAQRVIGSWWVESSHDVAYSVATRSSEHCIGCVSIRGARHSVLNEQYPEAEYEKIRGHIVSELKRDGNYGLFLPPRLSFFAYNETIAMDNMPLAKEEALRAGFRWEDDIPETRGQETLKASDIPDHIKDVPEAIVNEILACTVCGRNYRLTPAELAFYRRMVVPIPRCCFFCRFNDLIRRRGPMHLFNRTCAKCGKAIRTPFAPDRPEIVYCEACYNAEVV